MIFPLQRRSLAPSQLAANRGKKINTGRAAFSPGNSLSSIKQFKSPLADMPPQPKPNEVDDFQFVVHIGRAPKRKAESVLLAQV